MADIFSLTAPLTVREVDSNKIQQSETESANIELVNIDSPQKVVAECFKHPKGILYFDLYWHQGQPEKTMHLIEGELTGEGPWRINNFVFNVLGCRSTNIEMAMQHEQWLTYLQTAGTDYPHEGLILAIAKKMGAEA